MRLRAEEGFAELRPGAREGLDAPRCPDPIRARIFAARLIERFPRLAGRRGRPAVGSPAARELLERVFAYARLHALCSAARWDRGALVRFHTAHKLILMAHSPEAYQQLGRLVAAARGDARRRTSSAHTAARSWRRSRRSPPAPAHERAAAHGGLLQGTLDRESQAELLASHRRLPPGLVPLIVPMTLLSHYVRVHDVSYLAGQLYLEPHPKELMLRNHV